MMAMGHHTFGGERLQAFSDAVFAIVATIMVIPLKIEQVEITQHFNLETHLYSEYPKYLIYLFSFILVVDTWYSHTRIFSIVEHVDDVILWLNLLCLLFISFLPYGIGLVSRFQPSHPDGFQLAVSICAITIVLTGITMVVMMLYAFRKQALLHPEVVGNTEIRTLKICLLITLAVNPVLALVAEFFAYIPGTEVVSLVFFYSMGFTSLAVRTAIHWYTKSRRLDVPDFAANLFRTVANKTRTEAFSDGVFSIVATLIVLDLTTQVPEKDAVKNDHDNDLFNALKANRYIYLAYIASFTIVGLLWFVQYGMFHFLKKITSTLSFINTVTLCLVCGIPFVSRVYVLFADNTFTDTDEFARPNEVVAIRVTVVVIFLVGLSQLVFWTCALLSKDECLREEVDKYPAEILQFAKIVVFPTVSGVLYWFTFSDRVTLHHVFGTIVVVTPFLFLVLKTAFSLHDRCRRSVTRQVAAVKGKLKTRGTDTPPPKSPALVVFVANRESSPLLETEGARYRPTVSSPINEALSPTEDVPLKATDTS